MAIPTSPNVEPLQPQSVDLGASQDAQLAQMVAETGKDVTSTVLNVTKAISNSNATTQSVQFSEEINKARSSLYTNPTPENVQTQQQLVAHAAQVSRSADVLPRDKKRLEANIQSRMNLFNLEAARVTHSNNNRQLYTNFEDGLPGKLKLIHSAAANGDTVLAQLNAQALNNEAQTLIATGALPVTSGLRVKNLTNSIVTRGIKAFSQGKKAINNSTKVAFENNYFLGSYNPGATQQKGQVELRVNAGLNEQNLADAKGLAVQGILPTGYLTNPRVSPADFNHVLSYYQGVVHAKSHINTGLSYGLLQTEQDILKKKVRLTPQEEGIRDYLSNSLSQIKNDYFDYYVNQTNAGKEALLDYNHEIVNISNSKILNAATKLQKIQDADVRFRNKIISYGQSLNIPPQYIRPYPPNDPHVQSIEQAFLPGQNVQGAVTAIKKSGRCAPYVANSLKTPVQQETAHLVALSPSNQGAALLMQANQNQAGDKYGTLIDPKTHKPVSNTALLASLYANSAARQYLNYAQMLPGGSQRSGAIQKALLNAMKYCMVSNPTNTSESCANHLGTNVVPTKDSYLSGTAGGSAYNFLTTELHQPLSESDAQSVATYLTAKAYKQVATVTGIGKNEKAKALLDSQKMINPLTVTNGPDGQIIVYDPQTNNVLHHTPLTPQLISAARQDRQTQDTIVKEDILTGRAGMAPQEGAGLGAFGAQIGGEVADWLKRHF